MKGFSLGIEKPLSQCWRGHAEVCCFPGSSCVCLSLRFLPSSPPLCSCGPRQSRLHWLTQLFLSPWTVASPGRLSSSISQVPYLLACALYFLQDSRVISFGYCPHLTLCPSCSLLQIPLACQTVPLTRKHRALSLEQVFSGFHMLRTFSFCTAHLSITSPERSHGPSNSLPLSFSLYQFLFLWHPLKVVKYKDRPL